MKIKRISVDAERLAAIVEMAGALVQRNDRKKYALSLEFALAELVRSEMRRIAQQPHGGGGRDLLDLALDRVMRHVNESLRGHQLNIDLGRYASTVRDKLRFPAKEMQDLADNLAESRRVHKLGDKEEVAADSGRHCIVHELGLREAIQGLLAEPNDDCHELDIDELREEANWRLQGEWFPYELLAERFVFVIDDDGSVFVSTENLPPELREKASRLLRRVVDRLYA